MSSEEEVSVDSYGLLQKSKRSRRVDAGEPRNSYGSIPNFSSRPPGSNLLTSGLYSAFFAASQNQHHFGAIPPFFNQPQGFAPKMIPTNGDNRRALPPPTALKSLNDLNETALLSMENSEIATSPYDCLPKMNRVSANLNNGNTVSPPMSELAQAQAQHMLRNILQAGRNSKELFALEHEIKGMDVGVTSVDENHKESNNNISNNNNNIKIELQNNDETMAISENENTNNQHNGSQDTNNEMMETQINEIEHDRTNELENESSGEDVKGDKYGEEDSSNSETSALSPQSVSKDSMDGNSKVDNIKHEPLSDLKRVRVESIVSTMHTGNSLPAPVNGCKKRKLYHPQQHDNTVAEQYDINDTVSDYEEDPAATVDNCSVRSPPSIHKKVVEKNALKNKLKIMQEQLAEMQEKYAQLYATGEPASEEILESATEAENSSDIDQQDEEQRSVSRSPAKKNSSTSPTPTPTPAPTPTPIHKEQSPFRSTSTPSAIPMSAQTVVAPSVINKILNNNKLLAQNMNNSSSSNNNNNNNPVPHQINGPSFPIHHGINGALSSFIQHQMMQEQQQQQQHHHHQQQQQQQMHQNHLQPHHHHHHPVHPHPLSTAAMYLGVGQKLYMEQEARMAKEAAAIAAAERCHQEVTTTPLSQKNDVISPNRGHVEAPTKIPSNNHQIIHQNVEHSSIKREFSDKLQMLKNLNSASSSHHETFETDSLAVALKNEIRTSMNNLMNLIDRFIHTKRFSAKSLETTVTEQLNKELLFASQLLDRKSPRTKVIDRGNCAAAASDKTSSSNFSQSNSNNQLPSSSKPSHNIPASGHSLPTPQGYPNSNPENNINAMNLPSTRPPTLNPNLFAPSKLPPNGLNAAAALFNHHINSLCMSDMRPDVPAPEQNEALSLVMPQKKKRHKVTDTRITPRTVNRILAQDGAIGCPPNNIIDSPSNSKFTTASSASSMIQMAVPTTTSVTNGSIESPPLRSFPVVAPAVPPMLPVSLPTSVAIPNPSLHESTLFSPYNTFYAGQHQPSHPPQATSSPGMGDHLRGDSPPLPHHSGLFHPALLAAAQQQQQHHLQRVSSPSDYMRSNSALGTGDDPGSECTSMEYDGMTPTSSTLSPMHLRKAKLMFFWVRYPSSAVLKMYFPDIKFNKNNTAQLVKWFSNFREFYYIQMEKYARAAMAEGTKSSEDLHVTVDSDLYRILNLHYNRNNHIEVPLNFKYVVEQTLKEFFKAIQTGKDQEQSWKKSIYKVISRLDDPVPEYFKSPNFLEQLE